jgi:hypothetical protein
VSITLELPRLTMAETFDEFEVDDRFAFTAFFVYDDASVLRNYEATVGG